MAFSVTWTDRALKELRSIDPGHRRIIASWVNENLEGCEDPTRIGDCAELRGVENGWRWRMGNYRLLGTIQGSELVVNVFRVRNRRDAYRNLT